MASCEIKFTDPELLFLERRFEAALAKDAFFQGTQPQMPFPHEVTARGHVPLC